MARRRPPSTYIPTGFLTPRDRKRYIEDILPQETRIPYPIVVEKYRLEDMNKIDVSGKFFYAYIKDKFRIVWATKSIQGGVLGRYLTVKGLLSAPVIVQWYQITHEMVHKETLAPFLIDDSWMIDIYNHKSNTRKVKPPVIVELFDEL